MISLRFSLCNQDCRTLKFNQILPSKNDPNYNFWKLKFLSLPDLIESFSSVINKTADSFFANTFLRVWLSRRRICQLFPLSWDSIWPPIGTRIRLVFDTEFQQRIRSVILLGNAKRCAEEIHWIWIDQLQREFSHTKYIVLMLNERHRGELICALV